MLMLILIFCLIAILMDIGKGSGVYVNDRPKGRRPQNPPSPQGKNNAKN